MSNDSDDTRLPIACPLCGGEDVVAPANPSAGSTVECRSCGSALGRYGDVVALIREAAARRLEEIEEMIAKGGQDVGA